MAVIETHPLLPVASALSMLPADQNPVSNPSVRMTCPEPLQKQIEEINANPQLRAIALSSRNPDYDYPRGSGSMYKKDYLGWEANDFRRFPKSRHLLCGMVPLVMAAGAVSILGTWVPQTRFKGNRLVIPSNTTAGTIGNLLVGNQPQFVQVGPEPLDIFREDSHTGGWDMSTADASTTISAQFSSVAAQTIFSVIIGEAEDGKEYSVLRSRLLRLPIPSTVIAAGATVAVTANPQVRYKIRKAGTDQAVGTGLVVNSWLIGIQNAFASRDPVPSLAFGELAEDLWFDLDEAAPNNAVVWTVNNPTGGALTFQGGCLGDVHPEDLARM
jgi:hypothetical protein